MKKVASLLLAVTLVFSLSVLSSAAANTTKSNSKETKSTQQSNPKQESKPEKKNSTTQAPSEQKSNGSTTSPGKGIQKEFRVELNNIKKELQQQKSTLSQQQEALELQYKALLASGDTTGAEAVLSQIKAINEQANELKNKIKETINERFMMVKTMYSEEELAKFESASDAIAQMYEDAKSLDAGCVTVNNHLVKFDAPPYIKGGSTYVPLRAISEQLGAQVSWNAETQTVTITKEGTTIELKANSTTVMVNGTPTELNSPATVTNGRTYLPLRFLAETLNFDVTWDGDHDIIDIDDSEDADDAADVDEVDDAGDVDDAQDTTTNTNTEVSTNPATSTNTETSTTPTTSDTP